MNTKLLSKKNRLIKISLSIAMFFVSLMIFSQDPVATTNTEISGITLHYFFDEQVDPPNNKFNYAANLIDDDPDTDWAAQSNTGEEIIFDLGGAYDLTEIQHLTVTKIPSYEFQLWVSTDSDPDNTGAYVNLYPSAGNILSNQDNTYLQFNDFGTIVGVRYIKFKAYGRSDSSWNTASEVKFYTVPTASVDENELSGFSLYPNPADEFLVLNDLNNAVNKIEIISLDGKLVSSKTIEDLVDEMRIDTSFLENGMYIIKLSDTVKNISASKMIAVQH